MSKSSNAPLTSEQASYAEKYLPLAHRIASHRNANITGALRDDIRGAAIDGLIDAAQGYKPELGLDFSTYASRKINGAILDFMRKEMTISRDAFKKARLLVKDHPEEEIPVLVAKIKPPALRFQVQMGIDKILYDKSLITYLDAGSGEERLYSRGLKSTDKTPEQILLDNERSFIVHEELSRISQSLNNRNLAIVAAWAAGEMETADVQTHSQMGKPYNIRKARVSQILTDVKKTLRASPQLQAAAGIVPTRGVFDGPPV